MATRFGGVSHASSFATKVKWIVGCLVVVIVILVGTVVALVGSDSPQPTSASTPVETATQAPTGNEISILVAQQRIEKGTKIEPHMLADKNVPSNQAPASAFPSTRREEVVGRFATLLIKTDFPITKEDISDTPVLTALDIPPGFRAVTILVDRVTGVEGWAKPNARVDVIWTYRDDRDSETKVITLVKFVKILSVGGQSAVGGPEAQQAKPSQGQATLSLLVTAEDSQRIELARNLGKLSLTLVGEEQTTSDESQGSTITLKDLINSGDEEEAPAEGTMYSKDKSGNLVKYELRKGKWAPAVDEDAAE